MASEQNSETARSRTDSLGTVAATHGVTLVNDTKLPALAYISNRDEGPKSAGYVHAGKSVVLPTDRVVDAWVLFDSLDHGIFLIWPGPHINFAKQKLTLVPGQSYNISAFS